MPSNTIIRIGADATGANKTVESVGKGFGNLGKQARAAAKEASTSIDSIRMAMSSGGQNERIVGIAQQMRELQAEIKAAEAAGFGYGYEVYENDVALLRELKAEYQVYVSSVNSQPPEPDNEPLREKRTLLQRIVGYAGNLGGVASRVASIGSSARKSNPDLRSVVNSIRRIGIVSLGLRLTGSIFGRLRSIVSSYINENEALKAQVDTLKTSMGQALAPAINIVANAFSAAMPYIIGVSNAIGSLLSALFGKGWTAAASNANKVAKATGGAASAQKELNRQLLSFDTITKLNEENASGGSGGGSGAAGSTLEAIEGKTPAWAENFRKTFSDLFSSDEFKEANIGGKIGQILQTGIKWVGDSELRFDWQGAGRKLRENLDSFMQSDWVPELSRTLGITLGGFGSFIAGFLQPNWEGLKKAYEEGGLNSAAAYLAKLIEPFTPSGMLKTLNEKFVKPFVDGLKEKLGIGGEDAGKSWKEKLQAALRSISVPSLFEKIKPVSNFFAKFFGFSGLPDIGVETKTVWLARGGILDGAQIIGGYNGTSIGAGEAGKEAVLPLERNTGWMDNIADRVAARFSQVNFSLEATLPVSLDGREVARSVTKIQKQINLAKGS